MITGTSSISVPLLTVQTIGYINASILTRQRNAIKNLIQTMRAANGYHYDWYTVNQRQYALGLFPRAEVYCPTEENLDTVSGIGSNDYTNAPNFEIVVTGKLEFSSNNPLFDIQDVEEMAIDDLKMLFGNNPSVDGTCDSFLYRGFERDIKAVDQFIPTKIKTKWRAVYSQDRRDPKTFASS